MVSGIGESHTRPTLTAFRILVVDDDPVIARGTSRVLEQVGCAVVRALTGWKAAALTANHPADDDLILATMVMDLSLPARRQGGNCLSLKNRVAASEIVTA